MSFNTIQHPKFIKRIKITSQATGKDIHSAGVIEGHSTTTLYPGFSDNINFYANELGYLQRKANYIGENLNIAHDIKLSTYFSAYQVYIHNHNFYILRTPEGLWIKREGTKLICTLGFKDAAIFDFEKTPNHDNFVSLVCYEWSTTGKARITTLYATPHDHLKLDTPVEIELNRMGSVVQESAETKYFFALHEPMAGRTHSSNRHAFTDTHLQNLAVSESDLAISTSYQVNIYNSLFDSLHFLDQLAFDKFISNFVIQGVKHTPYDWISIKDLSRSNVSFAESQLPNTNDYKNIAEKIYFYLDVKQEVEDYFDKAHEFSQSKLSVQQAILDELIAQLELSADKESSAPPNAGAQIMSTLFATVGGFNPMVNMFFSILSLSEQLSESQQNETLTNHNDFKLKISELFRQISDEFIDVKYKLNELRRQITNSTASLDAWHHLKITWPDSEREIDEHFSKIFRKFTLEVLMPSACIISRSKMSNIVGGDTPEDIMQQCRNKLAAERNSNKATIAVGHIRDTAKLGGGKEKRGYRIVGYTLKLRKTALASKTIQLLFSELEFTTEDLMWHMRIPYFDDQAEKSISVKKSDTVTG